MGDLRPVSAGAPGGDGLDDREVPARRPLDAGSANGRSPEVGRRDRDADGARVHPREAALSAISGVVVFVVSLAWVRGVDAPLLPLVLFAILCAVLLHPRIFRPIGNRLFRPFGAGAIDPLPFPLTISLLIFYCGTWLIGGIAVYFLLRSLGTDPGLRTIPFLAGVSAVSAIVSVLVIFVPSGLGVREASMYGLLLAITTPGPALGATLLNRLAITVVEVVLFGVGVVTWRSGRQKATRREQPARARPRRAGPS